jgi:hypothetical protein
MAATASKVVKSAAPRKPPNAGKGRKKGTPNKVPAAIKEAIGLALDGFAPRIPELLEEVAKKDAARALEIVAKLSEYAVPKLNRAHITAGAMTLGDLVLQSFAMGDLPPPAALPSVPVSVPSRPAPAPAPAPISHPPHFEEQPYLPPARKAQEQAPRQSLLQTCYRPHRLFDEPPTGPAETQYDPLEKF